MINTAENGANAGDWACSTWEEISQAIVAARVLLPISSAVCRSSPSDPRARFHRCPIRAEPALLRRLRPPLAHSLGRPGPPPPERSAHCGGSSLGPVPALSGPTPSHGEIRHSLLPPEQHLTGVMNDLRWHGL